MKVASQVLSFDDSVTIDKSMMTVDSSGVASKT